MSHKRTLKTILIVDDDPLVARATARALRGLSKSIEIEIAYVFSGEDAWKYLTATDPAPDVIVSDFDMPYMTGAELWEKLEPYIQERFVFCTGRPSAIPENISNKRFMKPAATSGLLETVQEMLARK